MTPTPAQQRLLRQLGQAQTDYHRALEKYDYAFWKAINGGCRQRWVATELGVSDQAISQAVHKGRVKAPRENKSQGALFE